MKFDDDDRSKIASTNFVRLKDQQSIKGVFAGAPFKFKKHWNGRFNAPCSGVACVECANGQKPSFKFYVNFITKDADGSYVAKIVEGGWKFYQQLKTLNANTETGIENEIVSIIRSGSGKDDTTYMIMPQGRVSPAQEKAFASVKLLELDPNQAEAESPEPEEEGEDRVPF